MKLLVVGEHGAGALARSLRPGLAAEATVIGTDPYRSGASAWTSPATSRAARFVGRLEYRARLRRAGAAMVEAVEQLRPDAVLIVKGRGIPATAIATVRAGGVPVALYYPDDPSWRDTDTTGVAQRLAACTLTVVWSERIATELRAAGVHTRVLPFGYDPEWFPLTPPGGPRHGIVFLGTWSERRERYLAGLVGLPLVVHGTGWERAKIPAGPPVREQAAGALLSGAAIGVNLLHPQCAGAHNMRTREIAATGAVQLTDPGTDGTPLRPPESCVWFESPKELRALAEHYLARPAEAAAIAAAAQDATRDDTYVERGRTLARWIAELV